MSRLTLEGSSPLPCCDGTSPNLPSPNLPQIRSLEPDTATPSSGIAVRPHPAGTVLTLQGIGVFTCQSHPSAPFQHKAYLYRRQCNCETRAARGRHNLVVCGLGSSCICELCKMLEHMHVGTSGRGLAAGDSTAASSNSFAICSAVEHELVSDFHHTAATAQASVSV